MILHGIPQVKLLVLTVLVVIARLRGNHKHRIIAALAANMLDFLMLAFSFASAFDRHLAFASGTGMRVTDRHHFHV